MITNTTDAPTAGNFSGQTGTKVIYKYKAADYSGCKGTCLGQELVLAWSLQIDLTDNNRSHNIPKDINPIMA